MSGAKLLMAEFTTPDALTHAIEKLREKGYSDLDAYTPYLMPNLENTLGLGRSKLQRLVFPIAMGAAASAYGLMWYLNGINYNLNVGGRPGHASPAFVPITFETGVLVAGLTAVALIFVFAALPRLSHPVFDAEGFDRASIDRFYVSIDADDPKFDEEKLRVDLKELGAETISFVGDKKRAKAEPEAHS